MGIGRARNTSGSTYACTRCFSVSVGTRTNALTTAPALALTTCVKAWRVCHQGGLDSISELPDLPQDRTSTAHMHSMGSSRPRLPDTLRHVPATGAACQQCRPP